MKHYLDLVSISNKVHRRQSRMTRICIVLAVFLVAVMFGLADMYLKSMTDETRHQTGDWHCKITAIDEKTSEYIAARPEIDLSGWQGNIPAEIGCTVADQPVSVAGMDETIFSEIYLGSVLSGEFPEIAGQVAVSSTLAQTAGISLGDTLALNSPDGSTMQLAITGIMDDDAANMISGSASAILLTPEGLSSIQTADLSGNWQYVVRFSLLTNVGSSIADIQQQNGISDAQITQNEELLSMLGQLPGSNMSQIYTMAFLLSLVVMGTCVMMISSSLNSNVSQRIDTVTNTPGQVLFVANAGTEVQVGDTITLTINGKDQTVTVGGVLSDSLLARAERTETLICSEETFSQLTGETGYTILDVQFRFGSDEEDVAEVEALFGEGVTFTDVLIQAQQQRGLYYAFATLVYGFLSIIVAITIFHIMNDRLLNNTLCYNLDTAGYAVDSALTKSAASNFLTKQDYDLIVLDVNLPDGNGFDFCREVKERRPDTAVIFLTANDMESDMLKGYELGAEDYVTKPFPMSVFQKKLSVVLGRLAKQSGGGDCYEDSALSINFSEMTASLSGKALVFTPLEYRLLKILTKNPQNVLTRQVLLEKLWDADGNFVDEHALTAAISRVRNKIETEGCQYIKTVYGMGYMWIGGASK